MLFEYYCDALTIENVKAIVHAYQEKEDPHLKLRFDYYNNKQKILEKEAPENRPNNKVITNFCKQIVDTYQGYINLSSSTVDNEFVYNNLEILDNCLRESLIGGISYALCYYDSGVLKLSKLNPATTVIVRSTDIGHPVIGAVTWNFYDTYELGYKKTYLDMYVYDSNYCYYYKGEGIDTVVLSGKEAHYLPECPIFDIRPSYDCKSIFEDIMTLQDSYNIIDSSYLDSRETFSNSYLVISGMGVDEETATDMIDSTNRILNLPVQGASASYLTKPDSAADVIAMLDSIKRRIFTITCTPDFNDTQFNQQSGMALKHKLTSFINNINNISTSFENTALAALEKILGTSIEFTFNSYIPSDLETVVDMVVKLKDLVSKETLLAQLPFIKDVEEEIRRTEKAL